MLNELRWLLTLQASSAASPASSHLVIRTGSEHFT